MAKAKRAAIYARYSSDLQRDRSVDDQFADCEALALREGYLVVSRFSDRARSGATMFDRDGLLELREAGKARKFDVVIAESQSRLSRDPEDIAGILKRLNHANIELHTIADGIVDNLKSGLRAIIDSEYRTNLATSISRGQRGLVREGLFPGAVTYGYARVADKPAERVIHEEHAEIVRRIFREYADGVSPRQIASRLTADGIPAPRGAGAWNHQSFTTGAARAKGGILGNELYIGKLVWGQASRRKDPDTNVETRTPRPKEQHQVVSVPALRILPQHLWDTAQKVRSSRAAFKFGSTGKVIRQSVVPRGDHLLSGLLRCGACGGGMIICKLSRGKRYIVCSSAFQRSTCAHKRSYQMDIIQERALSALKEQLADPAEYAALAKTYATEYAEQQKRASTDRASKERQLNHVEVKIARNVRAIEVSDEPPNALVKALSALEIEKVNLEVQIDQLKAPTVIELHPNFIDRYLAKVADLVSVLKTDVSAPKNRAKFRNAIDRIAVSEADVKVYGRAAAIMGSDRFPPARSAKEILTSEGVMRSDIGNAD